MFDKIVVTNKWTCFNITHDVVICLNNLLSEECLQIFISIIRVKQIKNIQNIYHDKRFQSPIIPLQGFYYKLHEPKV